MIRSSPRFPLPIGRCCEHPNGHSSGHARRWNEKGFVLETPFKCLYNAFTWRVVSTHPFNKVTSYETTFCMDRMFRLVLVHLNSSRCIQWPFPGPCNTIKWKRIHTWNSVSMLVQRIHLKGTQHHEIMSDYSKFVIFGCCMLFRK